ncbi:coiled-coil domain-containing protein 12 isoform X1 [Aquila chrysaetos chrysaetos]|uniref:coiled-coil domain-containing protein 12 isoform X1 n=1 Tax=Aquila chrysaetos chrysaetos TaxID=223781 RepID=UPI0011767DF5|nr:coiled-coil domain-containing protein 12 isoform X1 [Aquila chrysaetos chrysaetos]
MAAPGGGVEAEEVAAGPALGRLEEEARRRRERLRALRQRTLQESESPKTPTVSCYLEAIGESSEEVVGTALKNKDSGERENKQLREDDEEETVKHKELKLRNYEPEDEELKKRKVPQAKPASVEDKVKDQLEAAKPEPIIDEVDLANLAPRKPDWDLKRDVAKKLEKLEKRTQRAIAELIRERLKGQEEELASAVGSAKQEGSDSD